MIGKFGLRLDKESNFVNVFNIENLYFFLAKRLQGDYFKLLEIRRFVSLVLINEFEKYEIVTDEYGYFRISSLKTELIWENHFEEDLPEIFIRGYLLSKDVLIILDSVIDHIKNNNWTILRTELEKLYEFIDKFYIDGYEISCSKSENSFFVNYYKTEVKQVSEMMIQNYISTVDGKIIIKSNFYRTKEIFTWEINDIESFFKYLEKEILRTYK